MTIYTKPIWRLTLPDSYGYRRVGLILNIQGSGFEVFGNHVHFGQHADIAKDTIESVKETFGSRKQQRSTDVLLVELQYINM